MVSVRRISVLAAAKEIHLGVTSGIAVACLTQAPPHLQQFRSDAVLLAPLRIGHTRLLKTYAQLQCLLQLARLNALYFVEGEMVHNCIVLNECTGLSRVRQKCPPIANEWFTKGSGIGGAGLAGFRLPTLLCKEG